MSVFYTTPSSTPFVTSSCKPVSKLGSKFHSQDDSVSNFGGAASPSPSDMDLAYHHFLHYVAESGRMKSCDDVHESEVQRMLVPADPVHDLGYDFAFKISIQHGRTHPWVDMLTGPLSLYRNVSTWIEVRWFDPLSSPPLTASIIWRDNDDKVAEDIDRAIRGTKPSSPPLVTVGSRSTPSNSCDHDNHRWIIQVTPPVQSGRSMNAVWRGVLSIDAGFRSCSIDIAVKSRTARPSAHRSKKRKAQAKRKTRATRK